VSKKSAHIAQLIDSFRGQELDPHYLGFFDCFNRQLFYEAHDVLEELWLAHRHEPNGAFYKGLIQLAGAFVHLQKNRLRPAAALFRLARRNLETYPASHERLAVAAVIVLMDHWCAELEACEYAVNPLREDKVPRIELLPREH
jgi:predicted metal-dependent hydrolase